MQVGAQGKDVGYVHQALLESGEEVPMGELATMTFGDGTRAAVKHFQAHHVGPDGLALSVDGVVGPATLWATQHPGGAADVRPDGWVANPALPGLQAVCDAAVADIGKHEDPDGSNDGPDLKKFNTGGLAWCAMAVSTWYAARAGGSPFGRIQAVWALYQWCKASGRVLAIGEEPRPGDLAIFLRAGGHGHVGLIVGILPGGRVCTVEGNCSNGVRAMVRDVGKLQAVGRPLPNL
jgi:hypothetical protein